MKMPLVTKTSPAAQTALLYITAGALVLVWSCVWLAWLLYHSVSGPGSYFVCTGCIMTGVTLLLIGLFTGPIGKASKAAEQPAEVATEVTRDEAGNVVASVPATQAPPPTQPAVGPPAVTQPATTVPVNGPRVTSPT